MAEYKLGELFCVLGCLAWGAVNADVPNESIVHEWATDYDDDTCHAYTRNICPNNPESVYCEDLH